MYFNLRVQGIKKDCMLLINEAGGSFYDSL